MHVYIYKRKNHPNLLQQHNLCHLAEVNIRWKSRRFWPGFIGDCHPGAGFIEKDGRNI